MRSKKVADLEGNEIVAVDIRSSSDIILIPQGTQLKKSYIKGLLDLDITSIYVEDDKKNTVIKMDDIIPPTDVITYMESLRVILEQHIYGRIDSLRKIEQIVDRTISRSRTSPKMKISYDFHRRNNLYEHTTYVTLLTIGIAQDLQMPISKLYQVGLGAILHDLGIRSLEFDVYNLDYEKLTMEQGFTYKKHPIYAYSEIEREDWIADIAKDMILFHHERMDGSGFPLKQKKLPLECKILQAVDLFDCMVSGWEMQKVTAEEAKAVMVKHQEDWFSKEIVEYLFNRIAF